MSNDMARKVKNPKRVVARKYKNYKAIHRPAKWGNPFSLKEYTREECFKRYEERLAEQLADGPSFLEPLRGYNIGCFCPLDVRCHGDIMLEWLAEHDAQEVEALMLERLLEDYAEGR